ncbi:MAG: NAD(P)/FAD-dependent oxidoreductase, partial [Rhodothermales bacterium]
AIVVGAGPGGATTAAFMAQAGLKVLLLDKAHFPRDKVCGDAVSSRSVGVLKELGILDRVLEAGGLGSWGFTFGAPCGDAVSIPYTREYDRSRPPALVCARKTFDRVLVERAVASGAEVWQGTTVERLLRKNGQVVGVRARRGPSQKATPAVPFDLHAPLVVGADGAYSVVVRELGMPQLRARYYAGAIRAYYEDVTGFHERNFMEIHFIEGTLPGYFWIFPMGEGRANVGVGMLSHVIKKRGVRLKALLEHFIGHPRFRDRFREARCVGPVKGWGLPLGSKPRPMAGDGWLLVGDAASLIDPFTGEGIGNAMVAGREAAQWARKAKEAGTYSAAFLHGYEQQVMRCMKSEFRLSRGLQHLMHWPGLLNFVVRKATRSQELAQVLSGMFDDERLRRRLLSPLFYLRLLRNR